MRCDICDTDFSVEDEPGGLLFGPQYERDLPPGDGISYKVDKFHACEKCWDYKVIPLVLGTISDRALSK